MLEEKMGDKQNKTHTHTEGEEERKRISQYHASEIHQQLPKSSKQDATLPADFPRRALWSTPDTTSQNHQHQEPPRKRGLISKELLTATEGCQYYQDPPNTPET